MTLSLSSACLSRSLPGSHKHCPRLAGPRDDQLLKDQEQAIVKLAQLYRDQKDAPALADILKQSRTLVVNLAKAKTAKLSQSPSRDTAPRRAVLKNRARVLTLDDAFFLG